MEIGNIIIMVLAGILMLTIIGGITISAYRNRKTYQRIVKENKAYAEGRAAFAMGIPCEENPYKTGFSQKIKWLKGWWDVVNENSVKPEPSDLMYKMRIPIDLNETELYRFHIARASINLLLREVGYNIGFTYEKDGEGLAVILFKKEHPHGPVL